VSVGKLQLPVLPIFLTYDTAAMQQTLQHFPHCNSQRQNTFSSNIDASNS